jgi:hypothetical protein
MMKNAQVFPPKKPSMTAETQSHLGVQLQRLFTETVDQPIPARFAELLDRLHFGGSAVVAGQADGAGTNDANVATSIEAKR